MSEIKIDIANDYKTSLGGRFESIGPFSGERFFEEVLKDKYLEALNSNQKLNIYLDGASPYGSSFLDQSFGQLARDYGLEDVKDRLVFRTTVYQHVIDLINTIIWK